MSNFMEWIFFTSRCNNLTSPLRSLQVLSFIALCLQLLTKVYNHILHNFLKQFVINAGLCFWWIGGILLECCELYWKHFLLQNDAQLLNWFDIDKLFHSNTTKGVLQLNAKKSYLFCKFLTNLSHHDIMIRALFFLINLPIRRHPRNCGNLRPPK